MKLSTDLTCKPDVSAHFDAATNTISYIVKDPNSDHCAIIDSVMDIDYAAGRITYDHADRLIDEVQTRGLTLDWIIETHVHADHLSAAPYIQNRIGGKIGVGAKIILIQDTFGKIFNEGTEFQRDGSQFDALFQDGDTYQVGTMLAYAIDTPGHTPACMVHVMGDAAFAGDTLFMPDGGSARCDFPGGDAGQLYDSIQTRDEFIKFRTERDATLPMPKLIIPSLQVNMRAGHVPTDDDGNPTLKVPLNGM